MNTDKNENKEPDTLIGEEVTLPEMLDCREQRARMQNELLAKYHTPLISFCMNIPGPVKTNASLQKVFESGVSDILRSLQENQISILDSVQKHEKTGDEMLLALHTSDAGLVKDLMTAIEETHPLGRLFDIDVLDANGNKLSRKTYRKCFLCGHQAQECASSRKHSVAELQSYIAKEVAKFLIQSHVID